MRQATHCSIGARRLAVWAGAFGLLGGFVLMSAREAAAQANYDETKVPQFTLPDPLVGSDGTPVKTAPQWQKRRGEILELFREHVYGRSPEPPAELVVRSVSEAPDALDGLATRKEVDIYLSPQGTDGPSMRMLLYLPNGKERAPAFLGLNFRGNHSIHKDPGISLSQSWMRPGEGVVDHRATEATRGQSASRWPVEMILKRGYAVATIYYGDIDPDFDDGFANGIHPSYYRAGQTRPAPDEWGSIAAWAWGLSRGLDYLQRESRIDGKRVAVIGHSRLGKTALWAGAEDERFALVISNNSGCGGAALSRREFGETVKRINTSFPHWFCGNFKNYNDRVSALPVDQHMLVALSAPRPVYIASAVEDRWADPKGEFLAALYAAPVYQLLDAGKFPATAPPPLNQPVHGALAYHIREGKHDVTAYDWQQYLKFADQVLK